MKELCDANATSQLGLGTRHKINEITSTSLYLARLINEVFIPKPNLESQNRKTNFSIADFKKPLKPVSV